MSGLEGIDPNLLEAAKKIALELHEKTTNKSSKSINSKTKVKCLIELIKFLNKLNF